MEKYDELSELVAYDPKLRYFTDQNGPKGGHMKMNFEYFQIQKWILQTVRSEKGDEKNGVICQVSMLPELWPLNCLKSAFFVILC